MEFLPAIFEADIALTHPCFTPIYLCLQLLSVLFKHQQWPTLWPPCAVFWPPFFSSFMLLLLTLKVSLDSKATPCLFPSFAFGFRFGTCLLVPVCCVFDLHCNHLRKLLSLMLLFLMRVIVASCSWLHSLAFFNVKWIPTMPVELLGCSVWLDLDGLELLCMFYLSRQGKLFHFFKKSSLVAKKLMLEKTFHIGSWTFHILMVEMENGDIWWFLIRITNHISNQLLNTLWFLFHFPVLVVSISRICHWPYLLFVIATTHLRLTAEELIQSFSPRLISLKYNFCYVFETLNGKLFYNHQ